MSFVIDYNDHFASFDRRLSPYNFLRYDDRAWRWRNPSLHYQSRLRHDDFLMAFDTAGLEIIEDRPYVPTAEDLASLRSLPLNERWAALAEDRVAIRGAHVVMRRPDLRPERPRDLGRQS